MKLTIFIGFILMNLALCKIDFVKEHDLEFEWEIIAKFMEDQFGVTMFVEKPYEDYGHRLLKYSLNILQFGVFYYNNFTLISQFWGSFQQIAVYAQRIYGVIIIMQDLDMIDLLIKANCNNKVVLVLFDMQTEYIKNQMKKFWDKHRTFTIIALSINSNGTNLIIQQNPFRSIYYEYSVENINSSKHFVDRLNYQFKQFMSNMYGHQLKIFIFDFPIISMPIKNKTGHVIGYTGMHGTTLKLTRQIMNFTPVFVRSSEPGSMFGLSAANIIEEGRAEIGLNGRFMLGNPFNNTVYLYPMAKVPFSFIVPINYEEEPLEIFVYFFFDIPSRINIGVSLVLTILIWLLGIRYFKDNAETATSAIALKVAALLHGVSVRIPKKIFNQIIFITIAFFGLLLSSVYQGMVVKQLSTPFKPHQLETLKDLLNSNLSIAVFTYVKNKIERNSFEDLNYLIIMGDIGRKSVTQYDQIKEGMDMVAYNKTTALLMPVFFFTPFSVKYFNKTTGLDLLHCINEPSASMFVSYIIARNSPYIDTFNRILKMFSETGVSSYESKRASYNKELNYIRRIKNGYIPEEQKRTRPIRLSDMVLVQYFMLISAAVACVVFLLEHVVHFLMHSYLQPKYGYR